MIAFAFEFLVTLAAITFVLRRRAMRRRSRRRRLGEAEIQAILEHGRLELDEPLDLGEIREEEKRFWEEERWE